MNGNGYTDGSDWEGDYTTSQLHVIDVYKRGNQPYFERCKISCYDIIADNII